MIRQTARRFAFSHEAFALVLLVIAVAVVSQLSPYFFDAQNFSQIATDSLEIGLIALAMTPLIVMREIDLSVGSTLGLTAVIFGELATHDVPLLAAIVLTVAAGGLAGLLNGVLVTRFGLSSIVVTLGTMALYRGLANAIVGDQTIVDLPGDFTASDTRFAIGTLVTVPHVLFLLFASAAALILHRSTVGRRIFFSGSSPEVAALSGVRVDRLKVGLFVAAGMLAAIAGLFMTSRLQSVRADTGTGLELLVLTVVLLGGADIRGGRGTIFGTLVALALVGAVRSGMALGDLPDQARVAVVGGLLLLSIGAGVGIETLRRAVAGRRTTRRIRAGAELQPTSTK
ncbi:ABC transporter permease [Conexibacter sp. CPCC 206217]|uniref:ABC transporter permease n=1 Tax=Conexibacter sp. CPCC 206217 TaxID=3064574 RepID=UPI00271C183D|nr:ABC transporter permease [Conexibacter sp. CPCC 206217]MDO8210049.1 ABC transporter permease [Conexibacter sp. CPCC 206217]